MSATFSYVAFDKAGRSVRDNIDAADAAAAKEDLRRQGLFVTEITAASGSKRATANSGPATTKKRRFLPRAGRLQNLAAFTRQLSVLVSSGTPLVQAITALERQTKDADYRNVLHQLRSWVEEGASLSQAMEQAPEQFDAVARSLIAAGEAGGALEDVLNRLATLVRKQLHVRNSVTGALVYPCLLIVISCAVLIVLLTFVLPRFAMLFKSLDAPLPPTTQFLMVISNIMIHQWWALILVGATFAIAAWKWLRTRSGKLTLDRLSISLPVFGPIVRSFSTARIARLLGIQVQSHVPLLDALKLTRQAVTNSLYADLISKAEDAATHGRPISAAFTESGAHLITPAICEALRNGEQTGQVGPLLLNIADYLDEENDVVVKSLTSIIEPLILIVLGVVVGFVAISLFLPMFDLTSVTQGGH